jgi:hypothetical protein
MSWANIIKKNVIDEPITISNYKPLNDAPENVYSYPYPHYVKSVAYECFVSMKEEADNHYYNIFQHITPNSHQELEYLIVNYMEHNANNSADPSQNASNNDNTMNNNEDSWWDGGVRNRFAYT